MPGTSSRSGGNRQAKPKLNLTPVTIPKPAGLSGRAAEIWDELMQRLTTSMLQPVDSYQMVLLCNLLWQSEVLIEHLEANPLDQRTLRLFHQNCQSINRLSALFGLSPVDRAKMDIESEAEGPDPFMEWLPVDWESAEKQFERRPETAIKAYGPRLYDECDRSLELGRFDGLVKLKSCVRKTQGIIVRRNEGTANYR